ncbi:MAG: alpha-1,2-fucosyltransferase [Halarcobacter sp.]
MILVNIIGGLGNQMFQYAYAYALKKRGFDVKLVISDFTNYNLHDGFVLDKYKISLQVADIHEIKKLNITKIKKKLSFLPFINYISEKNLLFDEKNLSPNDNSFIEGYFQCEDYFKEFRDDIMNEFVQIERMSEYTYRIEQQIRNSDVAISLHIRRGDYIKDNNTNNIHGTCSLKYYEDAIKYFSNQYRDIKYYIFSDDIKWVQNNFKKYNFIYIDSVEKRLPHEDIYLMSLCHHNIIANSSFSWWGAWMNLNIAKEVIAPINWFNDKKLQKLSKNIVPVNWKRL